MLLWYSQEARAYALFALLTAVSLLYFVRALAQRPPPRLRRSGASPRRSPSRPTTSRSSRSPPRRSGCCAAAAGPAVAGLWIVALAGLLLAPLAIHQMSIGHAEWIGNLTPRPPALGGRGDLRQSGRPATSSPGPSTRCSALVPPCSSSRRWLLLLALRRSRRAPRRRAIPLAIAAAAVGIPVLLALASPGKDYVLARNLLPALVPLLVAVAIGVTLRGARRGGMVLGAALVAYSLGFCVWASLSPGLQRPDWGAVAAQARRTDGAAGDRHLDAGRGLASLLPLDRLLPGPPPTASTGSSTKSTSSPTARRRRRRPGCSGPASARSATNRPAGST